MEGSSSSDQTLISHQQCPASPTLMAMAAGQQKSTVLSLESYELHTEFSDSTHSFEEVPRSTGESEGDDQRPTTNNSSGDELETATSSDIEIISNPNGCDSSTSRLSPHKDGMGGAVGALRGNRGHSR